MAVPSESKPCFMCHVCESDQSVCVVIVQDFLSRVQRVESATISVGAGSCTSCRSVSVPVVVRDVVFSE